MATPICSLCLVGFKVYKLSLKGGCDLIQTWLRSVSLVLTLL